MFKFPECDGSETYAWEVARPDDAPSGTPPLKQCYCDGQEITTATPEAVTTETTSVFSTTTDPIEPTAEKSN